MENIEFITYATHSEGTFDKLINNKYKIPITVLGWGEKWKGFMQKFHSIYEYIKKLPDDKIIFFIDGFDVTINKDLKCIYKKFIEMDSDIIISKNPYNNYVMNKIFTSCYNNIIANSGLYCGYNKYLKELLKDIILQSTSLKDDDQRLMNLSCKKFNIKIDVNNELFHNLKFSERILKKSNACFLGSPGKLSIERFSRIPKEYFPYLWKDIVLVIITILSTLIYYNKYEKNYHCNNLTSLLGIIFFPFLIGNADKIEYILFFIFILTWHSKHFISQYY